MLKGPKNVGGREEYARIQAFYITMPKLRTISDNALNALPPAALHRLGCLFTAKSEHFELPKCPELETCKLNGKRMPTSREMRDLYA